MWFRGCPRHTSPLLALPALLTLLAAGCSCGSSRGGAVGDPDGDDAGPNTTDGGGGNSSSRFDGGAGTDAAADADTPNEGPHSGSRIRLRGWSLEGVVTPSGILWDAERGVECTLSLSADGTTRCLPPSQAASVWFTDAECTRPVFVVQPDGQCGSTEPPPYAIEEVQLACPPSGISVYAPGTGVARPAELYYPSVFGCSVVNDSGNERFFEAVASPAEEWVRFERDVTKVTNRLGVSYWNGTDGSRMMGGLRLLPDDIPCDRKGTGPNVERCLPTFQVDAVRDYFAGESCQDTVGLTTACVPPDVIRGEFDTVADTPMCSPSYDARAFYHAEKVDSLDVFTTLASSNDGGVCALTPYGGFSYYRKGAEIRMEEFPVLDLTHEGTGRFQPVHVASEGHSLYVLPNTLHDTESGQTCSTWDVLNDGRTFCTSRLENIGIPVTFSDGACDTPLAYVGPCALEPPLAIAIDPPTICGGTVTVYRLGALHDGTLYQEPLGGPCASSARSPTDIWYAVGEPVDPAALFPLVTSTDL